MLSFSKLSVTKLPWITKSSYKHAVLKSLRRILMNPFWIEFTYFVFLSLLGFGAMKASKLRSNYASPSPSNLDMFFTSVSASTVSSMSTVEMEVLSNTQLIILTVLMFAGGEIFTSVLGLQLSTTVYNKFKKASNIIISEPDDDNINQIELELGKIMVTDCSSSSLPYPISPSSLPRADICFSSKQLLSRVILLYITVIHLVGSILIYIYTSVIHSARQVLENKGLHKLTFAVFTTVSTFANCGFIPTNENMIVFKKNSGLLLIMIPQILLGNTLYAPFLRLLLWVSDKFTVRKREELSYLLKMNSRKLGYDHLFSGYQSKLLAGTVFGFILLQFVWFCALEWNSEAMDGLSNYQKMVGSLFEVVNSRHAGESIVDLSSLSTAILVMFVVMMYLSSYTSFLPEEEDEGVSETNNNYKGSSEKGGNKRNIMENLKLSKQTYLVIFIFLICITERKKLKEDPLNFNLFNIVIEVISAYGNVGLSVGYSCRRQIKSMGSCKDVSYGFAGKWSDEGKMLLIAVMFFGRLKKFSEYGGKSWKVL